MALTLKTGDYVPKKKESSNDEAYKEIAAAYEKLPMGKFVEVLNSEVKSSTLEASIRDFIPVKEGERLRISRVKEIVDGKAKVIAVRLIKTTPAPVKTKPKGDAAQGEAEPA